MNYRMYFIDNLRAVTISMVVTLHVFLCYMKFAPSWWFVIDPEQSMFFTYGVILIDVPIMPVMFFIAGYFALSSLQKHGIPGFWAGKFRRIIIPWVLGVLFLAPPAMYMILLSRDKAPDYLDFWGGQFWSSMYSQSVFWFLGLLALFYIVLTFCYRNFPSLRAPARRSKVPSPILWVLFVGGASSVFLLMNLFYPVDTWISDYYLLVFQPLRLPVYFLYFWLGILAWKRNWFSRQGYNPKLVPWAVLSVLSAMLYLYFKLKVTPGETGFAIKTGNALGFNLFAFSVLMTSIAAFSKYLNSGSPFWKSFASCSYGIYLFHSLAVYYGAYFLLSLKVSPFIKAPVLLGGSILFCWTLTAALKKIRGVSSVL